MSLPCQVQTFNFLIFGVTPIILSFTIFSSSILFHRGKLYIISLFFGSWLEIGNYLTSKTFQVSYPYVRRMETQSNFIKIKCKACQMQKDQSLFIFLTNLKSITLCYFLELFLSFHLNLFLLIDIYLCFCQFFLLVFSIVFNVKLCNYLCSQNNLNLNEI